MSDLLLRTRDVEVGVVAEGGHLRPVRFMTPRGPVSPMHTAPWLNEKLADDVPQVLRGLSGDCMCAPFCVSDVLPDETRIHGATANALWRPVTRDDTSLTLELSCTVSGATVRKRVSVRPGQTAVYQEHEFIGGSGRLPIGHHAMLHADEPLLLGFAPYVWGGTPPGVFEPDPTQGRSLLAYPQTFESLSQVRLAAGGTTDVRTYPWAEGHEDLLMIVADQAPGGPAAPFGWSAATAPQAGWVWFALKSLRVLRNTVLWMSNGGRYYAPWSRRHTRCIGIEETTSFFQLGHRASLEPNVLSEQGYPTTVELRPEQTLRVPYVFGLVPAPAGFGRVARIEPFGSSGAGGGGVTLVDEAGRSIIAAVDAEFLRAG
jgi:hypothetical protein